MPEVIVKIEWDQPDDISWLPPSNVELCLRNVCRNTNFRVSKYDPPDQDKISMKVGEKEMSLGSLIDVILKKRGPF